MLPIEPHIPEISAALEEFHKAVVSAPPGAGKTTAVPPALLDAPWLQNRKILLLEPRRLAAVSCARHMADNLACRLGDTVGYRVRLDTRSGRNTRIEVMTEGVFTRKIQNDPALEDAGLVIFDEFHERSLHSDLGLALCLDALEGLREDLRILVMSATMDTEAVSDLLGGAPVIASRGKLFPVTTVYLPQEQGGAGPEKMVSGTVQAVRRALAQPGKDILVFLPGMGEIRRAAHMLEDLDPAEVRVLALHGSLPASAQAEAIRPSGKGRRKIVLSTAVAETSITIKGVDTVVDSGWMRISEFSPKTGMDQLVTPRISKAAADQRRGRAGRVGPGTCYRIWSEYDQKLLTPFTPPEILRADLAGVVLELAAWGVTRFQDLKWMDLPAEIGAARAKDLLENLGAIDPEGRITAHGRQMAGVGLHPRLAHMVIMAARKNLGALACRVAAFLNERDFLYFEGGFPEPDIRLRLDLIESIGEKKNPGLKGVRISHPVVQRILKSEKKIQKDFQVSPGGVKTDHAGQVLAMAYPDRIAAKREGRHGEFLTTTGRGVYFPAHCSLSDEPFIVAVHLDGQVRNSKIFLAAPCPEPAIESDFAAQIETVSRVFMDRQTGKIQAVRMRCLGSMPIEKRKIKQADPQACADLLTEHIAKTGLHLLPWNRKLSDLKDRIRFLENAGELQEMPDVSDAGLIHQMKTWLTPFLLGIHSLKQLEKMDLEAAFLSLFTWQQQKKIDQLAPVSLMVPSGSRRPLRYRRENMILSSPVLEVRIQEMFGLTRTPAIAGGRIPVTIALLSPAGRPVQITDDLDGFWKNTYPEVKKELAGRYPKHYWPDDPLAATPTSRAKPRKK